MTFLYDECDQEIVSKFRWKVAKNGYVYFFKDGRSQYLHRYIMQPPDDMEVDHINGNPSDNRRANLRLVTHAENLQNQKLSAANSSGFRGVSYSKEKRKFLAQAKTKGRRHFGGYFDTPEEASLAAISLRKRLFPGFVEDRNAMA